MNYEIQGAHTSADVCGESRRGSLPRYPVQGPRLTVTSPSTTTQCLMISWGRGGSSTGSSEIAEAEENFHKTVSNLVSTVMTEGAKVSGERGVALTSSILHLMPTLPLVPVLTPTIDLLPERECRIVLGDAPWSVSVSQNVVSSLPSSPLTGGVGAPTVAGGSTIRFGKAVAQPVASTLPGYPFFKQPASTPILTPQKGCGTLYAHSSPLLKESSASPEDTPDLTKSSGAPLVIREDMIDDANEASVPDKSGSSNMKSTHGSSKQRVTTCEEGADRIPRSLETEVTQNVPHLAR